MNENSLFFVKVKDLAKKEVFTCQPTAQLSDIAKLMKEKNISGIIVCEENFPLGVITDRDFRNKIIAENVNFSDLKVSQIMTAPVITVREEDYIFEAIYKMTKQNIHRLVVVNEMGQLTGILTDTDIIKYQTNTPLYFIRELEYAGSFDDLKKINEKSVDMIRYMVKSGVRTSDLIRFISHINDAIILRAIEIVVKENYFELPYNFSFLVLGSEGRMEQTLKTDQDNAIVYDDTIDEKSIKILEDFSKKLIDGLIYIGIPECPGGIMAKNSGWRKSLSQWKATLTHWINLPEPENTLNYSMFSDLRTIYGNTDLENSLKQLVLSLVQENRLFLAHMAKNVLRFPPPLTFFGNIKVEKTGEHKGRFDIKKAGIFPLTEGIKVLALDAGIVDGGTRYKINKLMEKSFLPDEDMLEIETSFSFFIQLRLKSQLKDLEKGKTPSNFVSIDDLNHIDIERLKIGFSAVKTLQNTLKERYNLNQIA
ncbi:MAG: hypothetical protein OHK0040_08630 [bacterium]